MKSRKKTSLATEADVLTRSRRRCCICFGLHRDVEIKAGQIAHLDGDRSNSVTDNLAFLCLQHHDQYDSTTSQSKNLTIAEVKRYRAELYEHVLPVVEAQRARTHGVSMAAPEPASLPFDTHRRNELKTIAMEVISEMRGPLRSLYDLAHRLAVTAPTAERLLFELAQEGKLRVDRRRGSTRKTYSMVTAPENRLIDTFTSQLDSIPVTDDRFIHQGHYELDSIVRTEDGTVYAVETMCVQDRLSRDDAARLIQQLETAKRQVGIPDAIGVLLIGITKATRRSEDDL